MKPLSARFLALAAVAAISLLVAGLGAGRFLVIDAPEPSDVLVVLAGDHNDLRYKRGLQLLADGYAPLMLADASSDTVAFGRTPVDLEQEFVQRTAGMLGDRIQVCPIRGGFHAGRGAGDCQMPEKPALEGPVSDLRLPLAAGALSVAARDAAVPLVRRSGYRQVGVSGSELVAPAGVG